MTDEKLQEEQMNSAEDYSEMAKGGEPKFQKALSQASGNALMFFGGSLVWAKLDDFKYVLLGSALFVIGFGLFFYREFILKK